MPELDPRLVKVGIETNGQIKYYEGLDIRVTGTKYGNANQNECEVRVSNLDKTTRDFILTETSPFNLNKTPKKIIIEAGRVSYGYSRIFVGDIITSSISMPPDLTITLKALTGNYQKGNVIARNQPNKRPLSKIAEQVSKDIGVSLNFQATDKNISNYSYSGAALQQIDRLGMIGNVNAYLDDDVLVVKNMNTQLTGKLRILDLTSGMIGIPELDQHGVKVKFLLDNKTTLGGALQITSEIYPAANGTYVIYQLGFDIASRDTPFYWIASAKRL